MGARYYNSISGQFLSPDPIGQPINYNLYHYANGDPINFYDPDGRFFSPLYEKAKSTVVGSYVCDFFQGMTNGHNFDGTSIARGSAASLSAYDLGWAFGYANAHLEQQVQPVVDFLFPQRNSTISYGELPTPQGILGNVAKLKNLAASAPRVASKAVQIEKNALRYKSFNKHNYRHNLKVYTGISPPSTMEAHHVQPQKYRGHCALKGLNVDEPQNLLWIPRDEHRRFSKAYEVAWDVYHNANPAATREQLLEEGKLMMRQLGYEVNY